jgi:hypothetical protein
MSAPNTRASPEVGITSPISMEMVVVLPAPLPPSRAVMEPSPSVKLMPSTAVTSP